jgi:tRNA A-37 threonylcarbamoyl transferase component Bud32
MSPWVVSGYAEERQLGHGASGRVVAAVHETSGQRVAIKYLAPKLFHDPGFLAGFRAEADLLRSLDVPQVVRLFDYVEEPGQGAAIVMELVDGVSLHEMISRRGATSPQAALVVLKGSLLGLAAAHALGIVHRDYKPENVLVDGEGDSKLSDFGVAVKAGRRVASAGTPLYMAPEQWEGAPPSPATDIYAATAVFFECLTSKTPFSGRLGQLQQQHASAAVPLDLVDEPLRSLIARGMAKNPAERPADAMAFLTQLESTAADAYGPAWEEQGRSQLKERAAALLLLLLGTAAVGAGAGAAAVSTWLSSRKRAVFTTAAVVIAVGAITVSAVALTGGSGNPGSKTSTKVSTVAGGRSATPPPLASATFDAVVTANPPVAISACTTPTTFTYRADLTATAAGTVSYKWVYSTGKSGPVRMATFTAPGTRTISGGSVQAKTTSTGWAAIRIVSPAVLTNKASYRLMCTAGSGTIALSADVTPTTRTVACGSAPPSFTLTGLISSTRAGTVTYHWALSDGATSPAATLTFTGPGTQAVQALTVTPPADTANGGGMLVVTSPGTATSNPADYSLTCTATGTKTGPKLSIQTSKLPSAQVGTPYSENVAATGGDGDYTWSASGLPPGLSLSSGGMISGTPTKGGQYPISLTVKDGESPTPQTATGTVTITVNYPPLSITGPSSLGLCNYLGVHPGCPTAQLRATGGDGDYTWSATGLPGGVTVSSGGVFSGNPTEYRGSPYTVTVTVTDGTGTSASTTYQLVVNNES